MKRKEKEGRKKKEEGLEWAERKKMKKRKVKNWKRKVNKV